MALFLSPIGGAGAQFFDNNGVPLAGGLLYTYVAGTSTNLITYTSSSGTTPNSNPIVLDSAGRPPQEIWLEDNYAYKFVMQNASAVQIWSYDNIIGINSNYYNYTLQEEVFVATQGQTVFTLATMTYTPGDNSLAVYVNGSKQIVGENYLETSPNIVTFISGLNAGDVVDFITAIPVTTESSLPASSVTYNQGGTGSVATTVEAKLQQTISVLDFIPANTNTATTDCTAYIQAAVNEIATLGGGTLYFPSGTYLLKGQYNPIQNLSRLTDGVTLTSNITIVGDGNSSIIQVDVNCANGFVFGRFRTAVTTAAASINNVIIRDIQFARNETTFFEQQYQCWIDSAVNVSIENVYFNGWSGDAIYIGAILNSDTSAWLESYTDNIQITNCTFDGINNNNRQAITIFSGTNITISNNLIRNTTLSTEPGAIDIEPELTTNVIQNISIHDNTFENIGGGTGAISINLYANLSNKAYNIAVRNNTFFNISNNFVFAASGIPQTTDIFPSNAPYEIVFDGNLCTYSTKGLFSVGGINNCKITNNHFASGTQAIISYYTGSYYQTQNLFISNNTFYSCNSQFNANTGSPLIDVHGTLVNASIDKNNFINCGIYNTSTSSLGAMQVFGFDGYGNSLTSSYIAIKDNIVNSGGAGYSTSYPVFYASGTLTNASSIAMFNNTYIGVYKEIGDSTSIYTQANSWVANGPTYFIPQSAPSNPKAGEVYYDGSSNDLYCWNGSAWKALF